MNIFATLTVSVLFVVECRRVTGSITISVLFGTVWCLAPKVDIQISRNFLQRLEETRYYYG